MARIKTEAYVVSAPGAPFKLEQVELDELKGGEVLVKMKATGICHTDLMVASGAIKVPMPIILGHEGVGEVQEVGPVTTTTLVKGDVVMMSFASCGQCHSCVDGHPAYCGDGKPRNWSGARPDGSFNTFFPASAGEDGALDVMSARPVAASFFGQSSFAKMAVVDVRSCVKVPPALLQSSSGSSIPFSHIAPFGCGFGTGAGTVLNVCKPPAGSSIAVYGVGAVGLAAIAAAAHLTPATTIIAVDILAGKLEVARRLGATVCIDSSQGPPVEAAAAVMGATGGRGLNFAIDTTGNAGVIKSMLEALGPNGLGIQLGGSSPDVIVQLNPQFMLNKGIAYKGVILGDSNPPVFLPTLLEHYKKGRFPIGELIKEYPYGEIQKAIEDVKNGLVVKPVLIWE